MLRARAGDRDRDQIGVLRSVSISLLALIAAALACSSVLAVPAISILPRGHEPAVSKINDLR